MRQPGGRVCGLANMAALVDVGSRDKAGTQSRTALPSTRHAALAHTTTAAAPLPRRRSPAAPLTLPGRGGDDADAAVGEAVLHKQAAPQG